MSRHTQSLVGQAIPWLRQQIFPLCIMMSRQLPLGGISLVATSALFFLQYWLSHDISLCRELVSICLKFNEHRAFHSLSTLRSSASNKSISHSNSYVYSIHFSQNLYRENNASLFPVAPSCELLELFSNGLFYPFFAFLHKHSATFMERI